MKYTALQFVLTLLAVSAFCFAQESVSAGGKWIRVADVDKTTGQTSVSFVLAADDADPDRHPAISITCTVPSKPPTTLYNADVLLSGTKLDPLNYYSPAIWAQVKVDDEKIYRALWDVIPAAKQTRAILDRKTLRRLLSGSNMRVRFSDSSDESHLDKFTIGGLDVNELRKTCGNKWFGKETSSPLADRAAEKR